MLLTEILFWLSVLLLFFCYIGYGLMLFLINGIKTLFAIRKDLIGGPEELLSVTMIVPAFNEIRIINQKIRNTLAIDYPPDKLTVIFITDGSIDGSETIVQKYPSIQLMHQSMRQGKMAAINRAMKRVQTPIVVFSDANALLNKECIKRITAHYRDPKAGGVAGEKKIINDQYFSAVGQAEGLYWRYESFMKRQDAEFNTIVGAAGELYSIRTELFPTLGDNIILDDFLISMKVCLQGFKIKYEPNAFATEFPSASLEEERKRKIRISAGAYQSIGYLKAALNLVKYPLLSFQYISRRLLRWIFCPFMLCIVLVANLLMVIGQNMHTGYTFFLFAQLLFYFAAIAGWLTVRSGKRAAILAAPFYFVFMNYCLLKGLVLFLSGKQTVLWEKAKRLDE